MCYSEKKLGDKYLVAGGVECRVYECSNLFFMLNSSGGEKARHIYMEVGHAS